MKKIKSCWKRYLSYIMSAVMIMTLFLGTGIVHNSSAEEQNVPEQLQALYYEWKDQKQIHYTDESYTALTEALAGAKNILENQVIDLTTGGEGYYKKPDGWLVFVDGDWWSQYVSTVNAKADPNVLPITYSYGTDETGDYQKILYNNEAFGLYDDAGTKWNQVLAQYTYETPVILDFNRDTLKVKIRALDDSHEADQPYVWFSFTDDCGGSNAPDLGISAAIGAQDFVEGLNEFTFSLSNCKSSLSSALQSYLNSNNGQLELNGMTYYNQSMWGRTLENCSNPEVRVYEMTVIRALEYSGNEDAYATALTNLQNAVTGLTIDSTQTDYIALNELYNQYKSEKAENYSTESYKAFSNALTTAKNVLNSESIDTNILENGTWYYKRQSGGLNFIDAAGFMSRYSTTELPAIISTQKEETSTFTRIMYNENQFGFYADGVGVWGPVITKYDMEPIILDFSTDVINIDINTYCDNYPNARVHIWLGIDGIGDFCLHIPTMYGSDIRGRQTINIALKDAVLTDEVMAYLSANNNRASITSVAFQVASATDYTKEDRVKPKIDIYDLSVTQPSIYKSAYENLLAAVNALVPLDAQRFCIIGAGADETERCFSWYTNLTVAGESVTDAAIQIAPTADMVNGEFPESAALFTGTVQTVNATYASSKVTVTGLQLDTEYSYRYGSAQKDDWSEIFTFTTKNVDEGFEAIFVGDPQLGASNLTTDAKSFNNTLNRALETVPNASMILSAGDNANGPLETEYEAFALTEAFQKYSLATVMGNHDSWGAQYQYCYNQPNMTNYGVTHGAGHYYFSYGDTLIIALNSNNQDVDDYKAAIDEALASHTDAKWRIVLTHFDIYGSGAHAMSAEDAGDSATLRKVLTPLLDEADIDLVLTGHDHSYTRSYFMKDYNAQTVETDENGAFVNPEGTLYITGSCSSTAKFYGNYETTWGAFTDTTVAPQFSALSVTDNELKLTTYVAPTDASQAVYVIDEVTIVKSEVMSGDLNDDGKTNVRDLVRIKKISLGTFEYTESADFDDDGACTATDITILRKYILGIISELKK